MPDRTIIIPNLIKCSFLAKKVMKNLVGSQKVPTFASQKQGRALSSAGSERLPYKQRVGGSNPSAPTKRNKTSLLLQKT